MFDAVVISDLHLGAEACLVRKLEEFLNNLPDTKRLILNGDVLENTEHRLTKHWKVLSRIRKLSDDMDVIWVSGNHDHDAEAIAHLVGATFVPEYMFVSGDGFTWKEEKILIIHGDIWDHILTDHPILVGAADLAYRTLQRFSTKFAATTKRNSKSFQRLAGKVKSGAVAYANKMGATIVVCGHTHMAEEAIGDTTSPAYWNTGPWTDQFGHFITIKDGLVRLEDWR